MNELPLVPVRMVNGFVYCPRLAYLMWAQAEWAETGDTVDGRRIHTSVDRPSKPIPEPETLAGESHKVISRSVTLSSQKLGIIAKIDIAESVHGIVTPIDFKRGKRPHIAQGAYQPERVQVCLQAMLLEEHGYSVNAGAIWYAKSRERVRVELDDQLRNYSLEAVTSLRTSVTQGQIPPPLQDSPKCPRCALVSICLPDELRSLAGSNMKPRPISIRSDDALPIIVQSQQAVIRKENDFLKIIDGDDSRKVRMIDVSDVALFGNVSITTPALVSLMEREIPVAFHSHSGWLRGITQGIGHRNVEIRTAQYQHSFDENRCLDFARQLIAAKIVNQRTILRRNWRSDVDSRSTVLNRLKSARRATGLAKSIETLLGHEGNSAAIYFRAFSSLFSPPVTEKSQNSCEEFSAFQFTSRNRRPPTDPINAMLSLAYAMLTRHITIALATVGLDPYRGFFHASRHGKPALALDIMEPFRPIISDSVVLSVVNTGEISVGHFEKAATGVSLTQSGRRRFVTAFERRLSQETTHSLFGYRLSLRRLLLLQARLLCRYLLGELPTYPHYLPR